MDRSNVSSESGGAATMVLKNREFIMIFKKSHSQIILQNSNFHNFDFQI